MQLILVVGKVGMTNQICQMLSFCWKLVSLFCWKKWLLSTLLSTVVTAKCACIRNTNACYFQCMHADQIGQHFNLWPNFKLKKRRHYPIIPTAMRYNTKGRTWPPMGVVTHSVCFVHARTLNTWKTIVMDTDQIRISICNNVWIWIVCCGYDIRTPLM